MARRTVDADVQSLFPNHANKSVGAARRSKMPAIESLELRLLFSTNWFVSTTGSDANAGTLSAPFRTIQHAAGLAQAGDTVLIRGGVYHETVSPANSGTQSKPITFEAYNGESVTVDGADPITGWSSGPNYHAAQTWDLGEGNNEVFVDGHAMVEARWPNTSLDPSHPTLAHAQSVSTSGNTVTMYDSALTQPGGYWTGGIIHFTPGQQWVAYTATVTDSGPGYVTFNFQPSSQWEAPSAGNAYYLTGKFQALDSSGEWYRDPTSNQLYLWPSTNDNPADHLVEAKHRLYAFDLSGVSNITVRGINLFAATINTDSNSNHVVLDHLSAKYLSQFVIQPNGWAPPANGGVLLAGDGDVLQNSEIAFGAGHGVFVTGNNDRVSNNVIHDVDSGAGDSAGVMVYGSWATVDHNTIYNTGRNGINAFGWQEKILYNTIHDTNLQTTDGGGIYAVRTNGGGAEIAYNRIYSIHTGGFGAVGIYLDNDSSNFVVDHNVTYDIDQSLKLNLSSRNQQIYNNTFDATQYSLAKTSGAFDWGGTVLANNIFTRPLQSGEFGATFQNNLYPGTDPQFRNPSSGDFTLRSGSPAVDAGRVVAPYTNGYAGSAPDQGAFESGVQAFVSGASIEWLPVPPDMTTAPASPPPPVLPSVGTDATSVIQAENFTATQGAQLKFQGTGYFDGGDWLEYGSINFGSGVSTVRMNIAVPDSNAGQAIQLRLDGPDGPVIATLHPTATSSWSDYQVQTASVAAVSGVHDLYLVAVGSYGIGNIDWLTFA